MYKCRINMTVLLTHIYPLKPYITLSFHSSIFLLAKKNELISQNLFNADACISKSFTFSREPKVPVLEGSLN